MTPGVLNVTSFEGHKITIQGIGDGNALLEVEGQTNGGENLSDSINMLARTPEVLELRHSCDASETAAYLTSERVWVHFELEMNNGQPVIGYGYYPVTPSDPEAFALNNAPQTAQWMAFNTGTSSKSVTLNSDIDDTTLEAVVVTKGQIDGIQEPIAFVLEDIDVGDTNRFYVRPTVGDLTICQGNLTKQLTSDTPDICRVQDRDPPDASGDLKYEYGWFEIEGRAAGTCRYTVTFPDGAGGNGVSKQFSYPIEP